MKVADCKPGGVYKHLLDGKTWKIRVTRLVPGSSPKEWEGVTTQAQDGVESGAKCWGKVKDLEA